MNVLLRWTGLGKLVSFYRYFGFNVPRATTAAGALLLAGVGGIRLYLLAASFAFPAYLVAYFVVLVVGTFAAAVCLTIGPLPRLVKAGWALGSLLSAASFAMYVISRTAGLPGMQQFVGRWDYALGTFSMLIAVMFLGLYFSVLTGMNIAVPQRRHWHS